MTTGAIGLILLGVALLGGIVWWGFFKPGTREDAKDFVNATAKKAFRNESPEFIREKYGTILKNLMEIRQVAKANAAETLAAFEELKDNKKEAEAEQIRLEASMYNCRKGGMELNNPEMIDLGIKLGKVMKKIELYNEEWVIAEKAAARTKEEFEALDCKYKETEAERDTLIDKVESQRRKMQYEGVAVNNDAALQSAEEARERLRTKAEQNDAILRGLDIMKEESTATKERKMQESIAQYDAVALAKQVLGEE